MQATGIVLADQADKYYFLESHQDQNTISLVYHCLVTQKRIIRTICGLRERKVMIKVYSYDIVREIGLSGILHLRQTG